ncbi:MAG: hypothetical protein ACRDND_19440 [Streptosporangiaceae bacterium]
MTFNDHADQRWDGRILQALASLQASFGRLCGRLCEGLTRFDSYAGLYCSALGQVETGHHSWLDAPDRDSLHVVWIQFHEGLLATLGIERGTDNR